MSKDHGVPPPYKDQIGGLAFAMVLLDPDLIVQQANPAAESILGRSARRMIGQSIFSLIDLSPSRLADGIGDGEAQIIARGLKVRVGERAMVANLTVSPLSSHAGWRVVTLSDTGKGEQYGEEGRGGSGLRGPAVIAHEIKNPLAAIRGAAQLLARKVGEGEKAMTSLITDEVDRIAQLIDRMQRLGRERVEPVREVNLHEAIHRAYETVRIATEKTVIWREEFDPSLPPVLANEGALVQVLINLMSNARDASAQNGDPSIIVRTRFVSGLVMNVIRLGRPVKLPIEIQVSDNGPGVDPALRDYIFEPFVSSKTNGQGLGLALVQKLVRDMDGRISHDRDESAGWTHFRVHLPMAKQGAGA